MLSSVDLYGARTGTTARRRLDTLEVEGTGSLAYPRTYRYR